VFTGILRGLRARAVAKLPLHLRNGSRGEDLAYHHLCGNGYVIVARNYRPRIGKGEIDLIGWDADRLAFIEVKTRESEQFGAPERAVDPRKRGFLVRAAREYVRRAGVDPARMRFDVVSVVLGETAPLIRLEKNAFSERSLYRRRR